MNVSTLPNTKTEFAEIKEANAMNEAEAAKINFENNSIL